MTPLEFAEAVGELERLIKAGAAQELIEEQQAVLYDAFAELMPGPKVGDGTPDAALAIAEHAFRAGFVAGEAWLYPPGDNRTHEETRAAMEDIAWSEYDPPEHIKALL